MSARIIKEKRVIWSDDEVEYLIMLCEENDIIRQLESQKYKKTSIFEALVPKMALMNYRRTAEQIRTKIKQLKHIFLQAKRANQTCDFYNSLNKIFGHCEFNAEQPQHSSAKDSFQNSQRIFQPSTSLINPKIEFVLCGDEKEKYEEFNNRNSDSEEEIKSFEARNHISVQFNDDDSSLLDSSDENDAKEMDAFMDIETIQRRKNKKHFNWNHTANLAMIHIWKKNFNSLRQIKRNMYIYCHMKNVLEDKYNITVSTEEIRNKIKNLSAKYKHEKIATESLGTASEWIYYDKVHDVMTKGLHTDNDESNASVVNDEVLFVKEDVGNNIGKNNEWSQLETRVFLEAFKSVCQNYKSNTCMFWKVLAKYLKAHNIFKTTDQCTTKWNIIRKEYLTLKGNNETVNQNKGITLSQWKLIDDILTDKNKVQIKTEKECNDPIKISSVQSVKEEPIKTSVATNPNKKHKLFAEEEYYELKKKFLIEKQELLIKEMQLNQTYREYELEYSKQKLSLLQQIVDNIKHK